ncbi:MAG: hypothetical protein KC731_13145 [Myxococcales bacterium]|nr:hypothetical protein [Myxococcales bacterium]
MSAADKRPAPEAPLWLWLPRLVAAGIMAFVAFLKLTGNPADVSLFTLLGMEPHGRILVGLVEGACALLLLSPYAATGGVLTSAVMVGALIAHATKIGFVVQGDGGTHILLLVVVMTSALVVAYVRRAELPLIGDTL